MTSPKETLVVLKPGDKAPDFTLDAYPQGTVSLSDFAGKKKVVLAFYPKDDTPGCTKEMCAFSNDSEDFESAGVQVLGISCDTKDSHRAFAEKHGLSLPLLADEEGKVGRLYGTVREGHRMANRVLFVIDREGVIRHIQEGIPDNAQLLELAGKV